MAMPRPPRFDGASLLNLAATIDAAYGNAPRYPLLADEALRERLLGARRFVLWLIDGLGVEPLQRIAPASALVRAMRGELSTVFPSSTAPALTALATARSPAQHAAPEWFIWFDELGAIYRALPLDAREPNDDHPPVEDASRLYPAPALASRADRPAFAVMPVHLAQSAYTRYAHAGATIVPYKGDDPFVDAVLQAVDAAPDACSVYAYEPRFDEYTHVFGGASERAAGIVARIDRIFERLAEALASRGVLLLATADHGSIDVPAELRLRLEDYPRVHAMLERPLCGGPRAAICHVRPEHRDEFADAVRADLGDHFVAVPSATLLAERWFGPDVPHPLLAPRLGTHMLLPTGDAYIVDRVPGEHPFKQIGMHGGTSSAEVRIPIITN